MSSPNLTGVVVQIRLGSSRLPGKALLPLGGATVADQVLSRLALVEADARVLATDEASASLLRPLADRHGFALLVGSPEDVLSRYCQAIRTHGLSRVIRATGDNPLVCHELATALAADPETAQADYASYQGLPVGMGVEVVKAQALLRAEAEARLPQEREHVCPYLYGHPELFTLYRPPAPVAYFLPEARVTVDTQADYEAVLAIYGALYQGQPLSSLQVLAHLKGRRP